MFALSDQSVLLVSLGALAAAGLVLFVVGWILFARERRLSRVAETATDQAPADPGAGSQDAAGP